MYGMPDGVYGGLVDRRRRMPGDQPSYRLYKIEFPNNHVHYGMGFGVNKITGACALYDWYLGEYGGAPNLLRDTAVSVRSNVFTQSFINAWRQDYIDNNGEGSTFLPIDSLTSPHLIVDFLREVSVNVYGLCIDTPNSGWKLYGSHDGKDWHTLTQVPPKYLATTASWLLYYQKWYTSYTSVKMQLIAMPDTDGYQYWGIVLGEIHESTITRTIDPSTARLGEVEFRATVAGVNLCVGGSPYRGISPDGADHSALFDGVVDSTFINVSPGAGIAYKFTGKVKPQEVAIAAGITGTRVPLGFTVVKSADGVVWNVHSSHNTPYGTWGDGVHTLVGFSL